VESHPAQVLHVVVSVDPPRAPWLATAKATLLGLGFTIASLKHKLAASWSHHRGGGPSQAGEERERNGGDAG
jgi:hypothetical protein